MTSHGQAPPATATGRLDGLRPVYRIERGDVRGFDPNANGYRLPTEAEQAYVARVQADQSLMRFPWGDERRPPEDRMGNYADRAAENLLARSIPEYTDGYVATALVGNYDANRFDLHDLGGNVAEWINDFYAATAADLPSGVVDQLGPRGGEYHVIRGKLDARAIGGPAAVVPGLRPRRSSGRRFPNYEVA